MGTNDDASCVLSKPLFLAPKSLSAIQALYLPFEATTNLLSSLSASLLFLPPWSCKAFALQFPEFAAEDPERPHLFSDCCPYNLRRRTGARCQRTVRGLLKQEADFITKNFHDGSKSTAGVSLSLQKPAHSPARTSVAVLSIQNALRLKDSHETYSIDFVPPTVPSQSHLLPLFLTPPTNPLLPSPQATSDHEDFHSSFLLRIILTSIIVRSVAL